MVDEKLISLVAKGMENGRQCYMMDETLINLEALNVKMVAKQG